MGHPSSFPDFGRPFLEAVDALDRITSRLEELPELAAREAGAFGRVRAEDPSPALRLLAIDGVLTDRLGKDLVAGRLDRSGLEHLTDSIINPKSPIPAFAKASAGEQYPKSR